jgi:voltage-gated potassium channel
MVSRLRAHWRRIIFQSSRWDEKAFDVCLIIAIVLSVVVVMLESIPTLNPELRRAL